MDADTAASGSAPDSASATVFRSGPGHGLVATGQPQKRRGSRPLAHGDESDHRHDQQEAEQTRITHDAQFQTNGTVREARRGQQPQLRTNQEAVTRSTPFAPLANPPTSDHLVALAFQGKTDTPG